MTVTGWCRGCCELEFSSLLYNKVQVNREPWNMCLLAGMLSVADVCEISKSKAEGWRSCVPEGYRSEIPYCSRTGLFCSFYFPFHSSVTAIWHQLVISNPIPSHPFWVGWIFVWLCKLLLSKLMQTKSLLLCALAPAIPFLVLPASLPVNECRSVKPGQTWWFLPSSFCHACDSHLCESKPFIYSITSLRKDLVDWS